MGIVPPGPLGLHSRRAVPCASTVPVAVAAMVGAYGCGQPGLGTAGPQTVPWDGSGEGLALDLGTFNPREGQKPLPSCAR